jgi:hypothetical protein
MSSDGRSTRPCALTAYPPATASPYRAQTDSAASTKALWSPSSTVGRLPRSQFRKMCLPCLAERSREAQATPVSAKQARVQPSGVVLPRNRRGEDRHVVQVTLDRVRKVKTAVSRPGQIDRQLNHAVSRPGELVQGGRKLGLNSRPAGRQPRPGIHALHGPIIARFEAVIEPKRRSETLMLVTCGIPSSAPPSSVAPGRVRDGLHLLVSNQHVGRCVVVTAIMLSALCDSLRHHAGGRSQSTPPQRAVSRPAAAAASAAPSRDTYAFVRGNVRSDL